MIIGWFPLITLIASVVVLLACSCFLGRTRMGRAFRATADNQRAAQLMGIDNRHLYGMAMAVALAIVAIGGVFIGIRTTFTPGAGPFRLIFAYEAVIIGGLGSLWGTLVGGIVLGIAQVLGDHIHQGWGMLVGHLVFLAILAFRPQGLFAKAGAVMAAPVKSRALHPHQPGRPAGGRGRRHRRRHHPGLGFVGHHEAVGHAS